ncbi:UDP-glucose/GDP-mannose dehydrogenase family protein [bacterium]|nr:UDP-glucose/GDP-mannose dehydrogenase family protein [bacterium]
MHLAFVGTGYVGLVSGTCFAESGNNVTCIDVDASKVERLRKGIVPIYEPGLAELVQSNIAAERLEFTTDLAKGIEKAELIFIAVGTPQGDDGSANLNALWSVVDGIREAATAPKIVVVKSTVPVGTNSKIHARLNHESKFEHEAASNPEFLKEGYAVEDFMKPDRVVVGVRSSIAEKRLRKLHEPFLRTNHPFLVMSPESAEMTKYVANCMLATKISFINEMANLCETMNADINDVRIGIGHDSRIGFQFLFPGVGYGGSCFPKDVRAMIALAKQHGIDSTILKSVDDVNENQKNRLGTKIKELVGNDLKGKTVALWGLSFKPRTDDIREAPSLVLIRELLDAGAEVRVHDPKAIGNVKEIFGEQIVYCDRAYGTVEGADVLAIVTEWQEFRNPDFEIVRRLMNTPIIVDGRNLYDPNAIASLGFTYASIGRATKVATQPS